MGKAIAAQSRHETESAPRGGRGSRPRGRYVVDPAERPHMNFRQEEGGGESFSP